MSKIKVSEIFQSLQGEGKFMGTPSLFVRTFGCNFSCSGFGMKRGELSTERMNVDPSKYTEYKKLPLVHTGCDSYPSWDPRFKHLSPMLTVEAIADQIQKLLPDGKFSLNQHLIITGGEPLLGWQNAFIDLFDELINRNTGLSHITFETNGTKMLTPELKEWIEVNYEVHVTFSVSAKLSISGEKWSDAIKPEVIYDYYTSSYDTYLKFVVANHDDIADVRKAIAEYSQYFTSLHEYDFNEAIPVYLMPCGGTVNTYSLTEREVADLCVQNGFRFSPRLQIPLYKNEWGT